MFGFVKSTVKLTNVRCNPQAPFCAVTVSLAPPGRTPEMVLRVAFSTSARIDDAGSDKGAGSASGGGGGGDDLAWLKGKIDRLEGKMDAIETKGDAATDFDAKLLASLYEQLATDKQIVATDKQIEHTDKQIVATDKQIELIKLQNEVTTGIDTGPTWDLEAESGRELFLIALDVAAIRVRPVDDRKSCNCAPHSIGEVGFDTVERGDVFAAVLKTWRNNYHGKMATKDRPGLIALRASSGVGKSHLLSVLAARGRPVDGQVKADKEFDDAVDACCSSSDSSDAFSQALRTAIGIHITFNHNTPLTYRDADNPAYAVGSRMLFSHFVVDDTDTKWTKFENLLFNNGMLSVLNPEVAYEMISADINGAPIVLALDEVIKLAERMAQEEGTFSLKVTHNLKVVLSSLSALYKKPKQVFFVMSSLHEGVLGASKSESPIIPIDVKSLTLNGAFKMAEAGFPPDLLKNDRFVRLLHEASGVARIVEKIVKVATSSDMEPGTLGALQLGELRTKVVEALGMEGKSVWGSATDRRNAVLLSMATSLNLLDAEDRDRCKTAIDTLLANGYLYLDANSKPIIPTMFLQSWKQFKEDDGALIMAVREIITSSLEQRATAQSGAFELQLANLLILLRSVTLLWHRKIQTSTEKLVWEMHSGAPTVEGMLAFNRVGLTEPPTLPEADDDAAFRKPLAMPEVQTASAGVLHMDLDSVDQIPLGAVVVPVNLHNPGFDVVWRLRTVDGDDLVVLLESKLWDSKKIDHATIARKLVNCFRQGRRIDANLITLFNANRLVFVVGGGSLGFSKSTEVSKLVSCCVDALTADVVGINATPVNVQRCLVRLTRAHTITLMSPTLSAVPPMAGWEL